MKVRFEYTSTNYFGARLGKIFTLHGMVETPAFVFCATRGAIKPLSISDTRDAGTQIILSNTYHLMLRPGSEHISSMGGIQKFIGWNAPMLTDSGGFQIFSLASGENPNELKRRYRNNFDTHSIEKISEEGVKCSSYYDGKKFFLTPELAIEIQSDLGSDMVVVLDECPAYSEDKAYTKSIDEKNVRWAVRSLKKFQKCGKEHQGLYSVIHGGIFKDLRKESAIFSASEDFFGQAIGGSLGKNKAEMQEVISYTMDYVSRSKPTHLLGVGSISDIFLGVKYGIDTFDCVSPTRIARHGCALIKGCSKEYINLRNACFKSDDAPIEWDCQCKTCLTHSRSYLNYLFYAKEPIVGNLIAYHNIYFMNMLMKNIRGALSEANSIQSMERLASLYLLPCSASDHVLHSSFF